MSLTATHVILINLKPPRIHTIVFHRYKTPPKLSLNVKVTVKFLIYGIPQENPKTNEARVIIMSPGFENRGN